MIGNMVFSKTDYLVIALSFALATLVTPLVRVLAKRWNMVAQPGPNRWHKKPTVSLGGVAIFITIVAIAIGFGPKTTPSFMVAAGSTLMFLVGLIDDVFHIKPYQKLLGQVMASALVVLSGMILPWSGLAPIDLAITFFWLVGITNAINLLDNMDGLAAGVVAIAAVFLAIFFVSNNQTAEALILAVLAATLVGFLVYNSHPASIFMGDCGSMFIGFFIAGAALLSVSGGRTRSFLPVLAVPVLILLIPIFDTTLVTLLRKLAGRPVSQGGRDHTSHRLVALGLSERRAVWLLYGLATMAGLFALMVRHFPLGLCLIAIAAFTTFLTLLGIYLSRVTINYEQTTHVEEVMDVHTNFNDDEHVKAILHESNEEKEQEVISLA